MAENTFRSPGFFEQEIDLTQREQAPLGIPAGVIGTAERGPAFVPVTVGSFTDFKTKFGNLNSKMFGPYAVNEFLKNRDAVTYVRVLGAGANETVSDISLTVQQGTVKNAGFKLTPRSVDENGTANSAYSQNTVHFLAANHFVSASEVFAPRFFTDNDSFGPGGPDQATDPDRVQLIRGMIFTDNTTRVGVMSSSMRAELILPALTEMGGDNFANIGRSGAMLDKFKLFISSSDSTFGGNDGVPGVRVLTASLDPRNKDYIRNILNTDPLRFEEEKHLLYACFDVEASIAAVANQMTPSNPPAGVGKGVDTLSGSVAMLSGSGNISANNPAAEDYATAYGRFDTRFNTPRTTAFISQPFGTEELELFHFELIDDGAASSGKYKVSIRNVRASNDDRDPYGTFTVQVRAFDDVDTNSEVLEEFVGCNLNPNSENFVGKMVGDQKAFFNFDSDSADERKLVVRGTYPNRSAILRISLHEDVKKGRVPKNALPFGFHGIPALKTRNNVLNSQGNFDVRLGIHGPTNVTNYTGSLGKMTGSILPPIPLRFTINRGALGKTNMPFVGQPGVFAEADSRFYWGVQTTMLPQTSSLDRTKGIGDALFKPNQGSELNKGLRDQLKFLGISKMDNLLTSSRDQNLFNNNKFTLARVAFGVQAGGSNTGTFNDTEITGAIGSIMRGAAYIRNGSPDPSSYTINDGFMQNRITFGTLIGATSSVTFNRFTDYLKFTNVFYGGFDGVNILDKNAARLNDKFSSTAPGGGANASFTSPGMQSNMNGSAEESNGIMSYQAAIDILTDPSAVRTNILAIPGIRDPYITDHAMDENGDYGMSLYVMDIPYFDDNNARVFDDSTSRPNVDKTIGEFERRRVDENATATYFPNVVITDDNTGENVEVPPSVAALAALGFNDRISYPWFAPAGFNRGSLGFVSNVSTRLNSGDRDSLYEARINPIASFPTSVAGRSPYVIFGQKTLQQAKSALDRVNVRRLLLEVKRQVVRVANSLVFEQNTAALRSRFVSEVTPLLAVVQAQSGIEEFRVVCDDSNNTQEDVETNRLNGKIVIVPTRSIEFISIDFIITNAGVSFE